MIKWKNVLGETEYPKMNRVGEDLVEFMEGYINFQCLKNRVVKSQKENTDARLAVEQINKLWNMGTRKTKQLAAKALRRRGYYVEFNSETNSYEVA